MTIIKKAGCVLINKKTKMIGLIYRQKQKDYSFSKGHLEEGETLEECAIRETEEETGRMCTIIPSQSLPVLRYIDSKGDETEAFYFLAQDIGSSTTSFNLNLVHEIIWVPYDKVDKTLSYPNLIQFWNDIKPLVKKALYEDTKDFFI